MSLHVTHELHKRRLGRNLGLGLVLIAFVALVFGLTVVKVTSGGFSLQNAPQGTSSEATQPAATGEVQE